MKVVNLFGGPGTGKSTNAAGVFYQLKQRCIRAELITEYAKDKVWEKAYDTLSDQLYVFGKQNHKLFRVKDKVDYAVTDSPLLLSRVYGTHMGSTFKELVLEIFKGYDNINIFLTRHKEYDPVGRMQTFKEACGIDERIKTLLTDYNLPFTEVLANYEAVEVILEILDV